MKLAEELRLLREQGIQERRVESEWLPEAWDTIKLAAREAALIRGEGGGVFSIIHPAPAEYRTKVKEALHTKLIEEGMTKIEFSEDKTRVCFYWQAD